MQVDLAADVFQDTQSLLDLLAMFRCFTDGPHDWLASQGGLEIAEQYLQQNIPALAATLIELGRKGAVATAWNSTASRPVTVRSANLKDYVTDLNQPAILVVENQFSDGCFVRTLAIVFGAQNIVTALSRQWLVIEHGGGSGLEQVTSEAALRFRRSVRVSALLDSDRMIPGEQTQSHLKADRLKQVGVTAHVLELREAENYVPNRVLRGLRPYRETSQKLNHLKVLTAEQRGHFDLKKGFGSPTNTPNVPPRQAEFFGNLHQATLLGLRGGFGDNLLQELEASAGHLQESDFESLGSSIVSELRTLLEKISILI